MNLHQELQTRGFIKDVTNENVFDIYDQGNQTFYIGFDPTADSLHVGNFVQFMHAVQYMKRGNHFILIVGGATGMIGDPGGKESERSFLSREQLSHNVEAITEQVGRLLANLRKLSGNDFSFEVINNLTFYEHGSYLDFLRDVGKHITVNQMMNKETVKKRIEDPSKSISYTEFSYMLMQGYDFYRLFNEKNCLLQVAGSDQRGNVITGIELIRKKLDKEAYGVTCNLILDSTGKKFGKSEGNALRLNPEKTSPFQIYQYFMNTTDDDVERYLKLFTLLDFEEIASIVDSHKINPAQRVGQEKLAFYVTQCIFGEAAANQAQRITETLYGPGDTCTSIQSFSEEIDINALYRATGGCKIAKSHKTPLLDALVDSGLFSSRGEAKKGIKNASVSVNEKKITDIGYKLTEEDSIHGKFILIRKGKKTYKTILIAS